jgi:protein disulfide-isomerase-like protein
MMKSVVASLLIASAAGLSLTPDNWDDNVSGKTVFIKFFAPWCGHCKKMAPDWEKLMTEYADHATVTVAEVDCTTAGKPLCDSNGVKGFPTIKHGDPANLDDYQGGRTYADFSKFAKGLKPLCSPSNMDLCDDEQKKKIEEVQALSMDDLEAKISEGDKKAADAESLFTTEVEKLQKAYQKLQSDKEEALEEIKSSGLGLYKSVLAAKKKAEAGAKEEL